MNDMNYSLARELLKQDEGYSETLYKDSVGKWTIGIGHNIQDRGLHPKAIELQFEIDLEESIEDCQSVFRLWNMISENRRAALVSVMFNLGKTRFLGFKNMIKAVNQFDFQTAADELLDSQAARDLPTRYQRLANILRG